MCAKLFETHHVLDLQKLHKQLIIQTVCVQLKSVCDRLNLHLQSTI